ncbi:MAG: ATP-binding protein [Hyphomicrobiaceae bacterium]|nr:ATP-binding protein [Hyphomicrobiaceae bacterium]
MQFSAKLALAFSLLLAVAIGSLALAFWTAREADRQLERSELGHRIYAANLALKADAYHLFKELSDALLIGDRDGGKTERRLEASLRDGLTTIRRMTAEEAAFAGSESAFANEAAELEHLAEIERKLDSILRQYAEVTALKSAGRAEAEERMLQLLDNSVDSAFAGLIDSALTEELREVAQADAEAAALLYNLSRTSVMAAVLALVLAAAGVTVLQRGVRQPLRQLTEGAEALAAGRLDHVIALNSRDEFGQLAAAFNHMTEEVAARQRSIDASRQALEVAVNERTAELQRANAALRKADTDRRRFLADISHELRTPLTIIRGEAEIALRARSPDIEDLHDVLRRVEDAAKHTGHLVDDLLFVARQEAGEARLRLESIDLAALVRSVAEEAEPLAVKAGGRIVTRIDVEPARMRADPNRLRQLFLVLIDNAVRYGAREGTVRVGLASSPQGFIVAVSDDGIGMSAEEKEHAFERFFRGADAATRYVDGTGLGLPVAKAIAESHGGSIAIDSEPGRGTTMTVLLPARQKLEVVA